MWPQYPAFLNLLSDRRCTTAPPTAHHIRVRTLPFRTPPPQFVAAFAHCCSIRATHSRPRKPRIRPPATKIFVTPLPYHPSRLCCPVPCFLHVYPGLCSVLMSSPCSLLLLTLSLIITLPNQYSEQR